jgi:hypothetical protein
MTLAGLAFAFVVLAAAFAMALGIANMAHVARRHFVNAQLAHRLLKRERPVRYEAMTHAGGQIHPGAA